MFVLKVFTFWYTKYIKCVLDLFNIYAKISWKIELN